jgi:glyoxylase-like metal-dependent hydrolase (beta-lactamase superfamily II)
MLVKWRKEQMKTLIKIILIPLTLLVFLIKMIGKNTGEIKKPKVVKINENTYQFPDGPIPVHMYLLIGSEKALLIDTGNRLLNLQQAIKEITDLPLKVVNTHGHFNHTHGNYLFDTV